MAINSGNSGANFKRNVYIKTAKEIIEVGLKRSGKQEGKKKFVKDDLSFVKKDATEKMKRLSESLRGDLSAVEKKFPDFENLPMFYKDTIKSAFDIKALRIAIASLKGSAGMLRTLEMNYLKKMWGARRKSEVGQIKKEFFGRSLSFVKRNRHNLELLKNVAIFMASLPTVKDEFTAIFAGFPNVGKSTLLSRLTTARPKIASYPFTTQSIMIGYMKTGYIEVQVIDTPGILDKKNKDYNPTEKRAVAAIKSLANVIVFVSDSSEQCGYPLAEQRKLLDDLKQEFRESEFIVIVNKADLASREKTIEAEKIFEGAIISGKGIENETREKFSQAVIRTKAFERRKNIEKGMNYENPFEESADGGKRPEGKNPLQEQSIHENKQSLRARAVKR